MPSSKNYKRNYKQEYSTAKKRGEVGTGSNGDNASRKRARRKLESSGVKLSGKDVAHRNGNPKDNRRSNLTTQTKSKNRSYPRNKKAGKKNATS